MESEASEVVCVQGGAAGGAGAEEGWDPTRFHHHPLVLFGQGRVRGRNVVRAVPA